MTFRAQLKKTFSRSSGSDSSSNSETSSTRSVRNSNTYKPGEKIPQKYRRPVDKAHKEKLEAFSFANAWRRKSFQSVYSPMGSRMPSQRNSIDYQMTRRSIGRRGHMDFGEVTDGSSDDTYSGNFSLSQSVTADRSQSPPPFTQEDLALALERSYITVSS
jgi:hypothetical protein